MNDSLKEKLDELQIEIGSTVFALQIKYANFIISILQGLSDHTLDLAITVPCKVDDAFIIVECKRVFCVPESGAVMIELADESLLKWNDLDLSVMDLICSMAHIKVLSTEIYKKIS